MKYSVVVIEDEFWIMQGIVKSFDWKQYDMEILKTFTDPYEAVDFLDHNRCDIVITDIVMPNLTGLEIIERFSNNERKENPQFVIISGYDNYEYMRKAIQLGIFDYCTKPIDCKEVDKTFKKLKLRLDSINKNYEGVLFVENDIFSTPNIPFNKLLLHIDDNISEKLILKELAIKFYFNSNYLCSLFKKYFNQTFSEYVLSIRMKRAKELLEEKQLNASQIAESMGFCNYSYFHYCYKKHYGITPSLQLKNSYKGYKKE